MTRTRAVAGALIAAAVLLVLGLAAYGYRALAEDRDQCAERGGQLVVDGYTYATGAGGVLTAVPTYACQAVR